MILSVDHDFYQKLPLADSMLICSRCGYVVRIDSVADTQCVEHYEMDDSGYGRYRLNLKDWVVTVARLADPA